jgi:CHAT domain-containing protein
VLSGLAFAGANRRAEAGPGDDDGLLTAEEASAMHLSGAEWVVLSACETGLGKVAGAEGVLGLQRGFRVAGARTTIMSLWQVDDESTRRWMSTLYRLRLGHGASTADAVRGAALEVLRDRRRRGLTAHPFHWAGFVAVGDWR